MLVQRRLNCRAALRLMRKVLKRQGFAPKLLLTDRLRYYTSAIGIRSFSFRMVVHYQRIECSFTSEHIVLVEPIRRLPAPAPNGTGRRWRGATRSIIEVCRRSQLNTEDRGR
jgi:hypothetical protein